MPLHIFQPERSHNTAVTEFPLQDLAKEIAPSRPQQHTDKEDAPPEYEGPEASSESANHFRALQ
jgi:hypothetical protein